MDDNYSMWKRHESEQEAWLLKRPVCCYCEQHIQDEYFYLINGEAICPDCMEINFRKDVEDYVE